MTVADVTRVLILDPAFRLIGALLRWADHDSVIL
jgi:hypothetical protein